MMHSAGAVMVAIVLAVASFAAEQTPGSITGHARLRGVGHLAGVSVTVTAGGVRRTVVTGIDGKFTIAGLAPGIYRVQGELAGFRTAVAEDVVVAAGRGVHVELLVRPGISSHIDYVMPDTMNDALKSADVVVHMRIATSLGVGLLGPDQTLLATQHAATVLAVVKGAGRGIAVGERLQFWQHMAGEWQEGGGRIVGSVTPYSVGQEFVAFLRNEPQGGQAEMFGPHFMFPVKAGAVDGLRWPSEDLHDGMPVNSFLSALRRLLK